MRAQVYLVVDALKEQIYCAVSNIPYDAAHFVATMNQ
jgi:hypothetical protein